MSTDFYAWCKSPCNRFVHLGQRYASCNIYFGLSEDDNKRRQALGEWIMDHFYGDHLVLITHIDAIDEKAEQDLNNDKDFN